MTKMDAESTIKAKEAFERLASELGNIVRHYHADNGLFDTKADKISTSLVECEHVKAKIGKALRADGSPILWSKRPSPERGGRKANPRRD